MPRKKTTEDFISDAELVHDKRYDYSKTKYVGVHEKVCIICHKHGEFWQEANNHLHGAGCPKCMVEENALRRRMPVGLFIEKATSVHNGKYDYRKVRYINTDTKVCIVCPEHGEFWQTPDNHLHGAGCPKCSGNYMPTTEEFVQSLRERFGDKYDYSKVDYSRNKLKVCVVCPEHGEFWMTPNNLLNSNGCPKCTSNRGIDVDYFKELATARFNGKYDYSKIEWKGYDEPLSITCPVHGEFWQSPMLHLRSLGCPKCSGHYLDRDFLIEKATAIHGDKYDYSKVDFVNSKTPVCIVCPKHGEFWSTPNSLLLGHGCRKCYNERTSVRLTKPVDDFIEIANRVHDHRYDYSLVKYENRRTPVTILCRKHGPFDQTPKSHIRGAGCPQCNNSILEGIVAKLLEIHSIRFIPQKTFPWLINDGTLHLDFFLPDYSIAVECQGIQHFQPVEFWGGEAGLAHTQLRDRRKKELCEKNGIKMLYFSNLGIRYPYFVIEDPWQLVIQIKSNEAHECPDYPEEPELPFPEDRLP